MGWELEDVEKPFVAQLQGLGWGHVEGCIDDPAVTGRTRFAEVVQEAVLRERLRAINLRDGAPWLDDERLAEAVAAITRPGAAKLMEANQQVTELLLKGITEVQTATRPAAAAEMVLVRIAYVADLPTPDEAIRMIGQNGGSSPVVSGSGASRGAAASTMSAMPSSAVRAPAAAPRLGTAAPAAPAPRAAAAPGAPLSRPAPATYAPAVSGLDMGLAIAAAASRRSVTSG